MTLDMSKFWASTKEAVADLGGSHATEETSSTTGGRWPCPIWGATVHGTPGGDVRLHKVDCYGWCKARDAS